MDFMNQLARKVLGVIGSVLIGIFHANSPLQAQSLQVQLQSEGAEKLAQAARLEGDAQRGAFIFHSPLLACAKCHSGELLGKLGPDLAQPELGTNAARLVEAVLEPSKLIRKGYEPLTIQKTDGAIVTGLLVEDSETALMLRDFSKNGAVIAISKTQIEDRIPGKVSIMPADQANQLASRQQFLDLSRYLIEIAEGGPARAAQLQPPASLLVLQVPEYESDIDHAGLIRDMNPAGFKRGEAIYQRLCINCHGTVEQPGSLPTSLKFASGVFKNGSDPYRMYLTLTHGYGLMSPQTWMVPTQKYDVVHYIRETYLKRHNPTQYARVDDAFLRGLPKGKQRGPAPSNIEPWSIMNYGPFLTATYEIPEPDAIPGSPVLEPDLAQKGIAIRLDSGPGGVARGRKWMVFEHDTLRMAAAWSRGTDKNQSTFIDWNGINFNGQHQIHPKLSGHVDVSNRAAAGWANPESGGWVTPRVVGRDGRQYGPLPRTWGKYRGLYQFGERIVLSYTIGDTAILEQPGASDTGPANIFTRAFQIGPRKTDLILSIASHPDPQARLLRVSDAKGQPWTDAPVAVVVPHAKTNSVEPAAHVVFSGAQAVLIHQPRDFDLMGKDYSIVARFRTRAGGTLFSQCAAQGPWVPNAKALFIRGGKLCFDIGWVGVVTSKKSVSDGEWHEAKLIWRADTDQVQIYLDGRLDGEGVLKPQKDVPEHIIRLGFAAPNFPNSSHFNGDLEDVLFFQRRLNETEVVLPANQLAARAGLIAHWQLQRELETSGKVTPDQLKQRPNVGESSLERRVVDLTKNGHWGIVQELGSKVSDREQACLIAGISGTIPGRQWRYAGAGGLQLLIPKGDETLRFILSFGEQIAPRIQSTGEVRADELPLDALTKRSVPDLKPQLRGGPRRWPETVTTEVIPGKDTGPLSVDILTIPVSNPWFCQMRLTGLDFYADGDRMAVCSWDGDVWLVSGINTNRNQIDSGSNSISTSKLNWQRIASGLFQPLGLKIVEDQIYVTCRDQIVILRDLNGDNETDYYECFNSDHQVTEHFHEFAMGLQRDELGNFYYAKSARHALKAVVPHHGTLLRVSPDGSRTDIIANGFRAANGVCLNPDGSFVVTDQEGHWNPKNRINWVREGGFYGNMFGYHDVTDERDSAMQPPLCWITNAFDRSPAELLWVDSDRWGPLNGSLLNFSYGYGKVFIVPHEMVDGQPQGGMCELPLPIFPTGIMRGRFNPQDGQLYACGMFAWAGSAVQPGGLYRIRATGKPVYVPLKLEALETGVKLTLSGELDAASVQDLKQYSVQTWSLKRTANYGSKHYDEKRLEVTSARLDADSRTIWLEIPDIQPTWCMEIRYTLRAKDGTPVNGTIHNTIHRLTRGK
jgi:putative heme-binding domain-containing protein